jgi:hypothetical protein
MNWYKEYQTEWKEIIETVARELGKSEQNHGALAYNATSK